MSLNDNFAKKKTMFQDYKEHPKLRISASILWEYDTTSPSWDWNHMAERVVQRVIQYGTENDYIAMLQLYGGFENVAEIIKRIPDLSPKDLNWACFAFNVRKEDTLCYTRKYSRRRLINS